MSKKIFEISLLALVVLFGIGLFFTSIVHAQTTTPTVTFTLSPSTVSNGGTFTATWSSTNTLACTGYGPGFSAQETLQTSGTRTINLSTAMADTFSPGLYPMSISCTKSDGTFGANDQKTLTVTGPVINNFTISPRDVTTGTAANVNSNFTITWSTTGATSCNAIPVVDLTGVTPTYEQAGSFPGQATFWSGNVGTSGSKSLSLPKTAWPNTYTFGLSCTDANGVTTKTKDVLNATWIEGKPKILTVTSPNTNSSWASGNSQTITWSTTNLPSTLVGLIYFRPHVACTSASQSTTTLPGVTSNVQCTYLPAILAPETYYIAVNIPNNGTFTWNGKDNYTRTNSYVCSQNGADSSCFKLSTSSIPTGTYDLGIVMYANPGDVYATNNLGQFIVDGLPSNIISKVPFYNQKIQTMISWAGEASAGTQTPSSSPSIPPIVPPVNPPSSTNTPNIPQVPNINIQPGCSGGNLYNPQTGQPCVNNMGNVNQGGAVPPGKYNFGTTTLYRGVKGDAVKELQRFLNTNLNLNLVIDGKIGPKTDAIIKQWQKDHGLKVDGRVGPKTKAMMNAEAK